MYQWWCVTMNTQKHDSLHLLRDKFSVNGIVAEQIFFKVIDHNVGDSS